MAFQGFAPVQESSTSVRKEKRRGRYCALWAEKETIPNPGGIRGLDPGEVLVGSNRSGLLSYFRDFNLMLRPQRTMSMKVI